MLLTKTPVRIAFGGGGTDVEPYCLEYGGYVINATINIFFRAMLNRRENHSINLFSNDKFTAYRFKKLEDLSLSEINSDIIKAILYLIKPEIGMDIYLHGEAPKRAGLGASASLCTCLISGILKLHNRDPNKNIIAEKAYRVEQEILQNMGGRQDQYAAVYGGFNEMEFHGNSKVKVRKISLSTTFLKYLENHIVLYYTGEPHTSGNLVSAQIESYIKNKKQSKKALDNLKRNALQMKDALKSEDFERLGTLLTADWRIKTKFNPLITTNFMEKLNTIVMKNGGLGGRVCGAGGGGCMFWIVDYNKRNQILSKLKDCEGKLINFKFVNKGLEFSNI